MSNILQAYRKIQFLPETPDADYFTYCDVKDLHTKCIALKHNITKCRTVGILQSQYGRYHLYDLDASGVKTECSVKVSLIYLKSLPDSTILPYPVQVFGTLEWVHGNPVLFIKILQVLTIPTAIKYKVILSTIAKQHLAKKEILQNK